MIKPMFSVYDDKACAFCPPFLSTNTQTAQRDFYSAVLDPNSAMHSHSRDYSLYLVGHFNDESSHITNVTPPSLICFANNAFTGRPEENDPEEVTNV